MAGRSFAVGNVDLGSNGRSCGGFLGALMVIDGTNLNEAMGHEICGYDVVGGGNLLGGGVCVIACVC